MASTRTASMHQPAKWERAAEPVASSLALLTPKGLGRLACTCRTWRDAAARVGTLVHIYSISSHCSDLDGDDGEHYGVSYLGREPPPFDSCRGPSGGILELSLLGRDDALDDGAREWPEDVDSDVEEHRNYSAVTVTLASPALVECICTCIEAVNAANITFHNSDIRNRTLAFDLHGDVRFVPNRLARLPRACSIVPMPILRQIAQKIVQTDPSGIGADWAARLLGNDPPWPLSLSDVKDRLRITRFHFDAPRGTRPRVDWTFFRAVLLPTNHLERMCLDELEREGLADRVLCVQLSRPPDNFAERKQNFVNIMNSLSDENRRYCFNMMLSTLPRREILDLWKAGATFTVPLVERLSVLRLNICRELIIRLTGGAFETPEECRRVSLRRQAAEGAIEIPLN